MAKKCSVCGKITTPKGEKGDQGDQGEQGPPGPSGGEIENSSTLGTNSFVYNEGNGVNYQFGDSSAAGQEIYYNGMVYLRASTHDTVTITPYGDASHQAAYVTNFPHKIDGDSFTYTTVPINGVITMTASGAAFGVNIACADPASEVEMMQINVNFTRQ